MIIPLQEAKIHGLSKKGAPVLTSHNYLIANIIVFWVSEFGSLGRMCCHWWNIENVFT
jgi:hypothetical protein